MRLAGSALVALVLLSGCTGPAPENPRDPAVAEGETAVRIVVQSGTDRVPGAWVLLKRSGQSGTTDDAGIFVAKGVPAGPETVVVNAAGFTDGRKEFVVVRGSITEVPVFVDRMR